MQIGSAESDDALRQLFLCEDLQTIVLDTGFRKPLTSLCVYRQILFDANDPELLYHSTVQGSTGPVYAVVKHSRCSGNDQKVSVLHAATFCL